MKLAFINQTPTTDLLKSSKDIIFDLLHKELYVRGIKFNGLPNSLNYETLGKNYAVRASDAGLLYVNVPWADNDTWRPIKIGDLLLDNSTLSLQPGTGISLVSEKTGNDNIIKINSTDNNILYNYYTSRQASMNLQFGDGNLRHFYATSTTTTGKPTCGDSHIIHSAWDNNGGWDAQLALPTTANARVNFRNQSSGTWNAWKELAYTSDIPTTLPASDVSAWAKASTKPSYSWNEITSKPTLIPVTDLAQKTDIAAIKDLGWYKSKTDGDSGTMVNSPYTSSYALLNIPLYDGGTDLRRARIAINANGGLKVSNDRGTNGTGEVWRTVAFTTDIPTTLPASDVSSWAKATTKPSYTWSEIGSKPTTFAPSAHNQASDTINVLTGYSKADSALDLKAEDSLNTALGKLEYKSDLVYDWMVATTTSDNDSNTTIDRLYEVYKVLEGISETDTVKTLMGKYLPLSGGTLTSASFGTLLSIKRNDASNGAAIKFEGSSKTYGYIGFNASNTDILHWNSDTSKVYKVLDSGNVESLLLGYNTTGKNYAVQASDGKLFVNVPWSDNDTWRPIKIGDTLLNNTSLSLQPGNGISLISEDKGNENIVKVEVRSDLNAASAIALTSSAGSTVTPIYFKDGKPTITSYSFGNGSGNAAINNGTVNTDLNADMLDGYHADNIFNAGSACASVNDNLTNSYRRIIQGSVRKGNWNDNGCLFYVTNGFINGCKGVFYLCTRTNSSSTGVNGSVEAYWVYNQGFGNDRFYIASRVDAKNLYVDVYYKVTDAYLGLIIWKLKGEGRGIIDNTYTLINSNATTNAYTSISTSTSEPRTYTEVKPLTSYKGTVYSAITASTLGTNNLGSATQPIYLENGVAKACTAYAQASVNYANSAGSATKATLDSDGNLINTTYVKKTDNLVTKDISITPTKSWKDTGIDSSILSESGTYIIQMKVDNANIDNVNMYYSGVMSWFKDATTDSDKETDEIELHATGSLYDHRLYLRTSTKTEGDSPISKLTLQLAADKDFTNSTSISFNFKKIL